MKERKVSIDIVKANVFAVVLFVAAGIVFFVPYLLIWHKEGVDRIFSNPNSWLWFLLLSAVGIVVHELIHGITWAHYAKSGWRSISFGMMWKYLTPYCHCNEPMRIRPYQLAALMPCIVLGIIPAVIGLCIGHPLLLIYGIFFISAAAGDIWMVWLLTKEDPAATVLDYPSEAGFFIYEDEY